MEPVRENRNGREEDADVAAELERMGLADEDPRGIAIAGHEQNGGEQNHEQDEIDYTYVSRDEVQTVADNAALARMRDFARRLEVLVYKNDPKEMKKVLDKRDDQAKVEFIKKIVEHPWWAKQFKLSESERNKLWKKMKIVLNGRVYRRKSEEKKKAEKGMEVTPVRESDSEAEDYAEFDRMRGDNDADVLVEFVEPNQEEDDIDYKYVSRDEVRNEANEAKTAGMSFFVRHLEKKAYENDPDEMKELLDDRKDQAKVEFMKKCWEKYFEIPDGQCEHSWKYCKEVLNGRVKRTQKKNGGACDPGRM